MGRVLAIDHGTVRLGIAISDESKTIAFGREVIANNKSSFEKLKELILTDNVTEIILGYPLSLKGEKTHQTEEVESFETQLMDFLKGTDITVKRWDERFTSKMAFDSMLESGMKKKNRQNKSNIDIISAALLLQSYLDSIVK